VRGDDPHALDLPPGNLRRRLNNLVRQFFQDLRARLPRSSLPEGHQLLWSQIHGLGADVVISWLEGAPRDDVDTDAK
jgi:hypothetical protein